MVAKAFLTFSKYQDPTVNGDEYSCLTTICYVMALKVICTRRAKTKSWRSEVKWIFSAENVDLSEICEFLDLSCWNKISVGRTMKKSELHPVYVLLSERADKTFQMF